MCGWFVVYISVYDFQARLQIGAILVLAQIAYLPFIANDIPKQSRNLLLGYLTLSFPIGLFTRGKTFAYLVNETGLAGYVFCCNVWNHVCRHTQKLQR